MQMSDVPRKRGFLIQKLILNLLLALMISSCKNGTINKKFQDIADKQLIPSGIVIDYPCEGTIFPPEIAEPQFIWTDTLNRSARWHIRLLSSGGQELFNGITDSSCWRPDSSEWHAIKTTSAHEPVSLTIIGSPEGLSGGEFSSGRISFFISKDSVGASVFYRAVPLPFGYAVRNVHEIEWYMGNISGGTPHKVLDKIPVCANCHSFSKSGEIAMDIDYANDKGSYIISRLQDTVHLTLDKIITWSDYKREDGALTYGLLSQISPDGKFVLSTVKDRSVFVAVDNLEYSQLFFPVKGIIAVYDRDADRFYELQGASDRSYVQSNPNWSPDGKEVLFSKADRYTSSRIDNSESVLLNLEDVEEFTSRKKEFKYDLFRIPFNGGKGGPALPVPGASENDKSNFFARYSPDGRWIVFCQAENFMLLQADSKLYIMPSEGGTPRMMNCNTGNMNSWHAWSPNSRWLVFSSKKRGPYTQLYLTHIDENGNDSPPVLLENMMFDRKAANIPEFFDSRHFNLRNMADDFSRNALYFNRLALLGIKDRQYRDVLENLDMAIKADSTFYDAYRNRLFVNITLGQSKSKEDLHLREIAKSLIEKELSSNPGDRLLYLKRGELELLLEDYDDAIKDASYVLKSNPSNYAAYELLAATYQRMEQWDKAVNCLKKMIGLQPDKSMVKYNLAVLYKNTGKVEPSLNLLNDLIEKSPGETGFILSRASLYLLKGEKQAAKADYDRAVSDDPDDYTCYHERGLFFRNSGSPDLGKNDLEKAIAVLGEEIRKNPQDAPLILNRAEIMEQAGNTQGALNEYENYLKVWPQSHSVLKKKALISYSMKQWQQAVVAYTAIIKNFPGDAEALCTRGLAYQQSGNMQRALSDLDSAIRLDDDEYAYYYFRSLIRDQTGDNSGSRSDLKTAANLLNELRKTRDLNKNEADMLEAIQKQLNEV